IWNSDFPEDEDRREILAKKTFMPMILGADEPYEMIFPAMVGDWATMNITSVEIELLIRYNDVFGRPHNMRATGSYWPRARQSIVIHEPMEDFASGHTKSD